MPELQVVGENGQAAFADDLRTKFGQVPFLGRRICRVKVIADKQIKDGVA